jgi:hypothetical protein
LRSCQIDRFGAIFVYGDRQLPPSFGGYERYIAVAVIEFMNGVATVSAALTASFQLYFCCSLVTFALAS